MKLHTVFVTHNRLDLTKQAVLTYLETVTVPFSFCIFDNASTDGTREWVMEFIQVEMSLCGWNANYLLSSENKYPGYACNRGWEVAPADATFLQRADNDFSFLPGWCDEVWRCFQDPALGQLGMRTVEQEGAVEQNVGGNNIIRRELWDAGLRYDERPWPEYPPAWTEDSYFSPAVAALGWRWGRVETQCIQDLANATTADPYYHQTFTDRNMIGLLPKG